MKITVELVERFHEKWTKHESGCWIWTGAKLPSGYGAIKKPGERKQIYAHRLSYMIHIGPVGNAQNVCHVCDNPSCVRPSHLFIGTQAENLQDMKRKGRHLYGSRNAKAKLHEDQVQYIHKMVAEGVSQARIGRTLGVSQSTIWRILQGKRYAHCLPPNAATP